jgi:tetratricopeptide (TPR) repeat protein
MYAWEVTLLSFALLLSSCVRTETRTLYDSFPAVACPVVYQSIPQRIEEAEQAAQKDPNDPRPHYFLGEAYLMRGEVALAEKEFLTFVQLAPQYAEPHYELARIYAATQRDDLALSRLQTALQLAPDFAEAHYAIAKLYEKKGDLASAQHHYQRYTQLKRKPEE